MGAGNEQGYKFAVMLYEFMNIKLEAGVCGEALFCLLRYSALQRIK